MQTYVNTPARLGELNAAISGALSEFQGAAFEWLSPLETDKYAELSDRRFWTAIGRADLAAAAADWWPSRGGPVWDAIAIATPANGIPQLVLIEAKANVREFTAGRMAAKAPKSIKLIKTALDAARVALLSEADLNAWTGRNYQLANRLAWTKWLRDHGQPTVFVHLLFAEDTSHISTSEMDLLAAAHASRKALGITPSSVEGWTATVVLPATD